MWAVLVPEALACEAAREGVTALVLDAESIPFVDVTAVRMLAELAEELAAHGVTLAIARDILQVRDVVRAEAHDPDRFHVYPTVRAAVDDLGPIGPGDGQA